MENQTNLTFGAFAKDYKGEGQCKNITELEVLNLDYPLKKFTGTDDNNKPYSYWYVEFNHENYRVPSSVIKQIQNYMAKMPNQKNFSVSKTGEGLKTQYQVIPIFEQK